MNSDYGLSLVGAQTYTGFNLWAGAVKKANSVDRMKVIEALEDKATFVGPAGRTTIDPKPRRVVSSNWSPTPSSSLPTRPRSATSTRIHRKPSNS